MANEQSKKDLLESLVDIRDVKIDRSKPVEERMKSYVEQIKNPYLFKVGIQSSEFPTPILRQPSMITS